MRKDLLIIALGLFCVAGSAAADVLKIPEGATAPTVTLPNKGSSMADVEKKFGAPRAKRPTVGGDSPKHPPITRWDYEGFSLIFEHDKVVDSVIPGAPPRVYNQEELQPVARSAAPLPLPQETAPPAEAIVPAEPVTPMPPPSEAAVTPPAEAAPAEPAPQSGTAYPDRPAAQTPAEEATPEAPPTPK
jgi:hypothetical protein